VGQSFSSLLRRYQLKHPQNHQARVHWIDLLTETSCNSPLLRT
jgi:hypothetical protein